MCGLCRGGAEGEALNLSMMPVGSPGWDGTMKRVALGLVLPIAAAFAVACQDDDDPVAVGPVSAQFDLISTSGEIFGALDDGEKDSGAQSAQHVKCEVPRSVSKTGTGIFVLTSSGHFTFVCHAD